MLICLQLHHFMIFIDLTWSGPTCPGPDTLYVLAQLQTASNISAYFYPIQIIAFAFQRGESAIDPKAGATKAGGVERWLPWTEMRHTNKTEISLAAMALVVTGNISVHNHRRVDIYMFSRVSLGGQCDGGGYSGLQCSWWRGSPHTVVTVTTLPLSGTVHGTLHCTLHCTHGPAYWCSTVKNPHK